MTCELCKAIELSKRSVLKHEYLIQSGLPKKHKVVGQANIMITKYQCQQCHTKWQYEDDKNDDYSGWTVIF